MVTIRFPVLWRSYTEGTSGLDLDGETVGEILERVCFRYPDVKPMMFERDGSVNKFLNIAVNSSDIRMLEGLMTRLQHGDEIDLIPEFSHG